MDKAAEEKWITIGGSLCQEALWGHKIYGFSVPEDFSWSWAGFLPQTCPSYHSAGFTRLRSFSSARLVPGSVGEAGAVQAVSLLSGGREVCWGGEIRFGTGWTTKELMDLGKQIHTNGVCKIKREEWHWILSSDQSALPPVSLLLVSSP